MALIKITIRDVTGRGAHLFADKTEFLLHSDGLHSITTEDDDPSKCFFYYDINGLDDRDGTVRVRCNQSAAVVAGYCEATAPNKFVSLSVYQEANSSSSTESISYKTKDICLAYDVEAGAIVYVRKGVLVDRIMVSESIAEILIDAGVTTTTTSTSTTSTSTTSTSSTSTSTTSTSSTTTSTTTVELSPLAPWYGYYENNGDGTFSIYITFSEDVYPAGSAALLDRTSIPLTTDFALSGFVGKPTVSAVSFNPEPGYTTLQLDFVDIGESPSTISVTYTLGTPPLRDANLLDIENFVLFTVVEVTTTSTSSSSSSTSSTSTSSTSTSSTSSTSTSSTSSTSTSSTSSTTTGTSTSSTTSTTTTLEGEALLNPDGDEALKDPSTGETLLNPQ